MLKSVRTKLSSLKSQVNWDLVSNAITFLTLLALIYQVNSTNKQYAELNRGYIDPAPMLELIDDSIERVESSADGIAAGRTFGGVNPKVELTNVGNLPVKYRVLRFDVTLSNGQRSLPLTKEDKADGIIYPQQKTTFFVRGIPFDPATARRLTIAEINELEIRCRLEVEYGSSAAGAAAQKLSRAFHWNIVANQARLFWDEFNDRW